MKIKKIIILILILQLITITSTYATNNNCNKITENIEYFTATLYDYNPIEFNEKARNMTQTQFRALTTQEKYNTDKTHTLIGTAGPYWTSWYGINGSLFGGIQNGTTFQNGKSTNIPYETSIVKGVVQKKLQNNNLVLTYPNQNNTTFFPTYEEAEGKGNIGNGKPYQEILRNYKVPFIKEKSGYYHLDSNNYHWKKTTNNTFELHNGSVGGLSEWNTRILGLFPFNKECYDDSNTTERNNLYYGMRIDINFYMTEDGKNYNSETNKLEDMIFEFVGDDDVYVFIDDTLILDMGGPSFSTASGYINFNKNQTYVNSITDSNLKIIPDIYENNVFGENTLSKGEHTITVFYLERFGGSANFHMKFNLPKKEEITQYSGTKIWKDDNNTQKLRPETYTLQLYADDQYLKTKTFTSENWTFDDLPKINRSTNQKINYTVKEQEINLQNGDKYIPTIEGNKVTNTLTGITKIEAEKIWKDNNNKQNTRPSNITFTIKKLLGGGTN